MGMTLLHFTYLIVRKFIHLSEPSIRFYKRQVAAQGTLYDSKFSIVSFTRAYIFLTIYVELFSFRVFFWFFL